VSALANLSIKKIGDSIEEKSSEFVLLVLLPFLVLSL
jgi:hypothetical protein